MYVCMISHSVVSNSLQTPALSLPGSSVHGTLQARILECVVISSPRGSSRPRDLTLGPGVSCIGKQILYRWTTLEAQLAHVYLHIKTYLDGLCLGWWTSSGNIRDYDKSLHLRLFSFCKHGLSFLVYKFCTQFVKYTLCLRRSHWPGEKIFESHV